MHRPWQIGLAFAACLSVVLSAMGWASVQVLRLDRAETEAKRVAEQEENVRLALWRMEAALAPLLAQEIGRPAQEYYAFYAAPTNVKGKVAAKPGTPAATMLPSPLLLAARSPLVKLYFQVDERGRFTSPQAPEGAAKDQADDTGAEPQDAAAAQKLLADLRARVSRADLERALRETPQPMPVEVPAYQSLASNLNQPAQTEESQLAGQTADVQHAQPQSQPQQWKPPQQELVRQGQGGQQARNDIEYNARAQRVVTANPDNRFFGNLAPFNNEVVPSSLRATWVGRELVLLRRVDVGKQAILQGVWLDWPALRRWLLDGVADLVPQADLVPVGSGVEPAARPASVGRFLTSRSGPDESAGAEARGRMLASLPARLVAGETAAAPATALSPLVLTLIGAWICLLVAAGAVAGLLWGTVALSERRGDFVSAVTHELRTPLTTFRMYSEMLAAGMVTDEAKRHRYLNTLRIEAERLSHLVENVLAYARLERGRARGRIEAVPVAQLVERVRGRLAERSVQAGMELAVEVPANVAAMLVLADTSVVEQILFNLVDNACKYAAAAQDKHIHLVAERRAGGIVIKVCDHGPGISGEQAMRLFQPFSKSSHDAANSAPGVGLGLALSRRLARELGGDLTLEPGPSGGACFVLRLIS